MSSRDIKLPAATGQSICWADKVWAMKKRHRVGYHKDPVGSTAEDGLRIVASAESGLLDSS